MAIEAIKTGVTYQGSTAQTESKSSVSNTAGVSAAEEQTEQNGTGSSLAVADETAEHDGIKIIDKDTKKVIREYPPEKTLDMIAKVWEMAGLMVDEKM